MTDVLGRNVRYHYDGNGNRTAVELPGGSGLENLYYGSGHLHRIAFDGETVTDIERDRLHRETGRTQGRLASRYTLDPLGRLKSQLAVPAGPSESKGKAAVTAAVKRSYGYDRTGNLTQSTDPRTGRKRRTKHIPPPSKTTASKPTTGPNTTTTPSATSPS